MYENVGGLGEQIGAHAQSNLDVLMQTMKELGYTGQPLRNGCFVLRLAGQKAQALHFVCAPSEPKASHANQVFDRVFCNVQQHGSLLSEIPTLRQGFAAKSRPRRG